MKRKANESPLNTRADAATAGTAFGALVGWGIATFTGADTTAIALPLGVLGCFTFGLIFPGK